MPWLGLGMADMARDSAAFNLPSRLERLFGKRRVTATFDTPYEVQAFP
jgi:hypothetical protein